MNKIFNFGKFYLFVNVMNGRLYWFTCQNVLEFSKRDKHIHAQLFVPLYSPLCSSTQYRLHFERSSCYAAIQCDEIFEETEWIRKYVKRNKRRKYKTIPLNFVCRSAVESANGKFPKPIRMQPNGGNDGSDSLIFFFFFISFFV